MGLSFAVFYTFFGIPLGRLADSKNRRTIIALGFALWSLFTAGCGVARNFVQMLLLRMGVGVGEAALSPSAYSIIADYFSPKRRATAISVYSMGIYIGSGLAFIIGGTVAGFAAQQEVWQLPLIGSTRPWQVVFFIVGLPGILFALLMYTVREPERRGTRKIDHDKKSAVAVVPMKEVVDYLWLNRRTFICHNVGFALLSFSSYGSTAWIPTFFVRNHGWTEAQAGQVYGWIVAIFGTLGVAAGVRHALSGCFEPLSGRGPPHPDIIYVKRSIRCRPRCHPTDDAQCHARAGIGHLSVRGQFDRPWTGPDCRRIDDPVHL
jgi:MFS family permease